MTSVAHDVRSSIASLPPGKRRTGVAGYGPAGTDTLLAAAFSRFLMLRDEKGRFELSSGVTHRYNYYTTVCLFVKPALNEILTIYFPLA